jgi:putative flippase GtrA
MIRHPRIHATTTGPCTGQLGALTARLRARALRDPWLVQLVSFCVVGGVGTGVNLLAFSALNLGFGMGRSQSASVAWLLALLNNYVLNRHFTFASSGRVRVELPRFAVASLLAFGVNLAVLRALSPVDALLAQSLAILAATPVNFIFSRLWAFAAPTMARTTVPLRE